MLPADSVSAAPPAPFPISFCELCAFSRQKQFASICVHSWFQIRKCSRRSRNSGTASSRLGVQKCDQPDSAANAGKIFRSGKSSKSRFLNIFAPIFLPQKFVFTCCLISRGAYYAATKSVSVFVIFAL